MEETGFWLKEVAENIGKVLNSSWDLDNYPEDRDRK